MSDWSDGVFDNGAAEVADAGNWANGDFWQTLANDPVAQSLGIGQVGQVLETANNWVSAEGGTGYGDNADLKNPAGSAKTESSGLAKWWGGLTTDDKKIGLSMATLLAGGLSGLASGKRRDRELNIMQQNADANLAAVNERKRQFDVQMANGSAIAQTNFGSATGPGMINAPVTLTRNRLLPTPGAPA